MLCELSVKNIALIDELKLPFGPRLNVLTGETGAGKSILVESINFALGGRVKKDLLRSGARDGFVELLFHAPGEETAERLRSLGIEAEDDGSLLVARSLTSEGRTISRVNGRTVTLSMLRQVTAPLIDIHGQHEHQSLIDPVAHRDLLDLFAGPEHQAQRARQAALFGQLAALRREMERLSGDERERERRADLLRHQLGEIEAAALDPVEEEELEQRRRRLQEAEKIRDALRESLWLLCDGDEAGLPPAGDAVRRAAALFDPLTGIDSVLDGLASRLAGLASELDDLVRVLRSESESGDYDAGELNAIEARLNQYFLLKRKYGDTVAAIHAWRDEAAAELTTLEGADERLDQLGVERSRCAAEMHECCERIRRERRRLGGELAERIAGTLSELAMSGARFAVAVEETEPGESGADRVEFLIAPNRGEPLKPLRRIASGGEMSRVMLALKSAMAEKDRVETLLFDEIDAGVSGKAAQKVAGHLARVSACRQVICVTHLPQIAAMADDHFRIEKREKKGRTFTTVGPLPEAESLAELARLLSGVELTPAARENARQMKSLAEAERQELRAAAGGTVKAKKGGAGGMRS